MNDRELLTKPDAPLIISRSAFKEYAQLREHILLPRWRGWRLDGRSLGVVEAVDITAATKKLRTMFGDDLAVVVPTFRGAALTPGPVGA